MEEILKTFDLVPRDVPMIIFGALLFTALWKILEKSFFRPFQSIVEARESATGGASTDASDLRQRAENLRREYQAELSRNRAEAVEAKLELLDGARKEAAETLAKAQSAADRITDSARAEVEKRESELQEKLQNELEEVVELVVKKVQAPLSASPEQVVN